MKPIDCATEIYPHYSWQMINERLYVLYNGEYMPANECKKLTNHIKAILDDDNTKHNVNEAIQRLTQLVK